MINLKKLRAEPDIFIEGAKAKNITVDIPKGLKLDQEVRKKNLLLDEKRQEKNTLAKKFTPENREKSIAIGQEIKGIENDIKPLQEEFKKIILAIPNPPSETTPIGKSEEENLVLETKGEIREFSFSPRDHEELGILTNTIDIERARKVSGARFYYLKGKAALLHFALINFALEKLIKASFVPVVPPVLVREQAMYGTGFFPADENEIFAMKNDDLFLVGTSEVPLCAMHGSEVLDLEEPVRYAGISSCFRREAGSYGKDTKGILRVHQFDKIEMFSFCRPEESEAEHEKILKIEKEIMEELELPFQVVNICSGDLGAPATKKYDLEVYIPTQKKYRELTSCSNCTDFQSRRMNIKYCTKDKKSDFVHTLNGTCIAVARMIVAIFENYQNEDGSVTVPTALQEKLGFSTIGRG